MRNGVRFGLALVLASFALAQTGRTVQVDVAYTGSGKVDASHKMYVAMWASDDMSSGPPIASKTLESKTGTVSFTDVQTTPVYITVAFDPTGSWAADSPPPSGTSLGMYSTHPPKLEPINVEPGKTAKVKVTFDDTNKIP